MRLLARWRMWRNPRHHCRGGPGIGGGTLRQAIDDADDVVIDDVVEDSIGGLLDFADWDSEDVTEVEDEASDAEAADEKREQDQQSAGGSEGRR